MYEFVKIAAFIAVGVGSLTSTFLLLLKDFRSGSSSVDQKIITSLKERNSQLEAEIPRIQDRLTQNERETAKIQGQLEEKDKYIKTLTDLVQNRNPEMLQILTELKDTTKLMLEFLHQTDVKNTEKLDYQTGILEANQARDTKVDKANNQ